MPGVYVSYPFCRQKCTYCNFASGLTKADLERAYSEALLAEIRKHSWSWTPETVYLGGGSPDLMDDGVLRATLDAIPGHPWNEATLEASPGDITEEAAACWVECGVDRVSLGVQSFVESEIRTTGRKHTAPIVAADVRLLRQAGIRKINIDLIAGLPGQTPESWTGSLDWMERLEAGHVSVYMLEVDENSRLGRELLGGGRRYGASKAPEEGRIAEFYETAVERLEAMGIPRYEISNFARRGEESVHNLKYWRLEPYLGFGADAHSFDGTTRRENARTAVEYVERWRTGSPVCTAESPARPDEERFFVGLRLSEGIELKPEDWDRHRAPLERFLRQGLLERSGGRVRLTGRGVLLSNEVFQEFLKT